MKNFFPKFLVMYSICGHTCCVGSGPNMKMFLLQTPGKYSCSWPS